MGPDRHWRLSAGPSASKLTAAVGAILAVLLLIGRTTRQRLEVLPIRPERACT
jgi:hypothetical protein